MTESDFVFDTDRIKWNTPEDRAAFEASGNDWADEIALELKRTGHLGAKPVAAALRKVALKNKADGMREALSIFKEWDNPRYQVVNTIQREASRLDPPNEEVGAQVSEIMDEENRD